MTDAEIIAEAMELARWRKEFGPRLDAKKARATKLGHLHRAASDLAMDGFDTSKALSIIDSELLSLRAEIAVLECQERVWRDLDIQLYHDHIVGTSLTKTVRESLAAAGLPHI